ncbi:hypothetical protein GOBAR_AA31564 [Gossypium barbadense]|uniref:CSN8/PSMD8/EIF3K domain-containing protein n=1 Tax=Gossypium barbadense TaxID=3634 RepID=A0A2P5WDF2_GOSBA|nr:hypothetical protein GOBAR_AA31564 [Gossypium barbadense]
MLYINNARFLWRSIHPAIKESQPELVAAWKIGQKLWTRDYAGVYDAFVALIGLKKLKFLLLLSQAKLYTKRMFELLLSAYSTISIQDAAQFLGMSEEESTNCDNNVKKYLMVMVSTSLDFKTSSLPKINALQRGWIIDPASQMLIVTKQCIVKEQKLDPSKLQRLTEYVFHLEH